MPLHSFISIKSDGWTCYAIFTARSRSFARLNGLTCTGTLGVLVKAKQRGLLPKISPVIEDLRQTTMYLTPFLIEKVLEEAGEV